VNHSQSELVIAALTVKHGLLQPEEAVAIIKRIRANTLPDPIRHLLVSSKVRERDLLSAIASELGTDFVDLYGTDRSLRMDYTVMGQCELLWMERLRFVPMLNSSGGVTVACADPTSHELSDTLDASFGVGEYTVVLALGDQIDQLLLAEQSRLMGSDKPASPEEPEETLTAVTQPKIADTVQRTGPVVQWLDSQIVAAISQRASDLHFEIAHDKTLFCRFRIDGELHVNAFPYPGRELEVIGALMNKSGMDTADLRRPQDGSFTIVANNRSIDARVAMIRLVSGPKIVIRLLDPRNLRSLQELGFTTPAMEMMLGAATKPQGLVVVAGPTGSGKTTTLYALLEETKSVSKNIVTIENPVEYRLRSISQIPVTTERGDRAVTFAGALRTVLRLDPDVILVGEIRDEETARTALDAAITGHLVLTTVHAPSALGVFMRLIEMGAPPYLVADAMTLAISQRLVKRVHTCTRLAPPTDAQITMLQHAHLRVPEVVANAAGCAGCRMTGYQGRIAVAEMAGPDDEMRSLIISRAQVSDLEAAAARSGSYLPIESQVQQLLEDGDTTVEEVLRALTL
jgi:type IV pilus assembly protein PilB